LLAVFAAAPADFAATPNRAMETGLTQGAALGPVVEARATDCVCGVDNCT
jgi:hypothetical protein